MRSSEAIAAAVPNQVHCLSPTKVAQAKCIHSTTAIELACQADPVGEDELIATGSTAQIFEAAKGETVRTSDNTGVVLGDLPGAAFVGSHQRVGSGVCGDCP